jgi:hypothetical protein
LERTVNRGNQVQKPVTQLLSRVNIANRVDKVNAARALVEIIASRIHFSANAQVIALQPNSKELHVQQKR